jgi:phage-related baseplate assembly protein
VTTQGTLQLVASASAPGPTAIGASDLVFKDENFGHTYRNRFAFTLTPATTHEIEVEAETAAADRDVANDTITIMETAIAGCTVSNPAIGVTGTWITRNGADEESTESLRTKNRSKWSTLGLGPGTAYEVFARQGHESVRRVYPDATNPRGPGTFDIYIAGDSGSLSPTVVTAVTEYIDGTTDGIDRVNPTADMLVLSATDTTVVIVGSVYVLKQYNTPATQALIEQSIADYFKVLPIGGVRDADGNPGSVPISGLYGAIIKITGVQNVAFASPTADYPLLTSQVAVPAVSLTYYPV